MVYTVAKLAKLSGVSIRTLHWYDEVGLLKPAYHGINGYRYYEEEQLLTLQQILFFRELGFELKQIQAILKRSDFDQMLALSSHRKRLQQNVMRTKKLILTIDKTIEHLKGTKKMKDNEIYLGFSKEKQTEYQDYLIHRFGDQAKASMQEQIANFNQMDKEDLEISKKEWEDICKDLAKQLKNGSSPNSPAVQKIIRRHYEWLKGYWTADSNTYPGLGDQYVGFEWKGAFEAYDPEHPKLAKFMAEGMKIFAEKEL